VAEQPSIPAQPGIQAGHGWRLQPGAERAQQHQHHKA
jgi:hypothetical protein